MGECLGRRERRLNRLPAPPQTIWDMAADPLLFLTNGLALHYPEP
jgi:hypothetical protein